MPEWIGKTISKVRIEKYLARGGMAEVYLGTHLTLDRRVAVKVLHSHIEEDPSLLARFQREAKVVAGLRHANIVQIFDFDTVDGHPFIVMEYLSGSSLAVFLRNLHNNEGRLSNSHINRLLSSLASALDYAHWQGVIHRDVKPGNVLLHGKSNDFQLNQNLTTDIEPILTDFGLVRIAHSASQTTSGTVTGTPAYMSPEQASGDPVDSRTDVYSLGIVLYEMLAGRVPFEADSTLAVLLMHINQPPPPIKGIHPSIQQVIDVALAKDPEKRYQTCHELKVAFQSAIEVSSQVETIGEEKKLSKQNQVSGQNKKRVWVGAGVALFLIICCAFLQFNNNPVIAPTEVPTEVFAEPVVEETPTEVISFVPPDVDGIPVGTLHFSDGIGTFSQATLSATLLLPPENFYYEAWLVGDGISQSLGALTLNESGGTELFSEEPQGINFLTLYNRFEIVLRANDDSTSEVFYSSSLPPESFGYMYPLIINYETTPNQVSFMSGSYAQIDLINLYTTVAMLGAYEVEDEAGMRANAEAVINMIVGNQNAEYFGDWDGNGESVDPSDGFGLLANGEQAGYISGAYTYTDYISISSDANVELKSYAESVKTCGQNLDDWAVQLRDLTISIVQSPFDETLDPVIRQASALASSMLSGVDADGNQSVDPIVNECGVLTMYGYAYYLPDMYILPGANQVPVPAP